MEQGKAQRFVEYDRSKMTQAPDSLRDYAERSIQQLQSYVGHTERRTFPRHYNCFSVVVIPMANEKEYSGQAFEAMSRDISQNGIALYQNRVIRERTAVVELTSSDGASMQMLMTIVRCRPAGMFFEVAGYFDDVLPDDFCRKLSGQWNDVDPDESLEEPSNGKGQANH